MFFYPLRSYRASGKLMKNNPTRRIAYNPLNGY